MKCPNCATKITYQNKPKDDIYSDKYECPNCNATLASDFRGAKFVIFLFILMPIIWGVTSLVTYLILGSMLEGREILGDEAVVVIAFVLGTFVSFYFFLKQNALKRV